MDTVFSCCYTALAAIVLSLLLKKFVPEISSSVVFLAMIACFTAGLANVSVIKDEIMAFAADSQLPEGTVETVIRICSVGIVSKLCSELCRQAGEASLSSAVDFLGTTAAVFVSLPLWQGVGRLLLSFLNE